jgi:hypothetical protein
MNSVVKDSNVKRVITELDDERVVITRCWNGNLINSLPVNHSLLAPPMLSPSGNRIELTLTKKSTSVVSIKKRDAFTGLLISERTYRRVNSKWVI